jgi:hypothetical protein
MTTLRPYQRELVDGVRDAWTRHRSVLMQLGTGGGKTHTAATLISELPGRVVFAAHLDSLITDTARRLRAHGVECGVVAAGHEATPDARVQVCSLGTLHARGLTPPAETVVLDECHRAKAASVQDWLDRYPTARHLGLTATPQRGDGQPLGDVYDVMVQGPTVAELTEAGHLVASHVLAPPEGTRGDVVREMGDNMTADDNAIVFARSKQEGNVIAQRLRAMGYPCAEVYGDSSARRREEARDRLRAGDLRAIVGVGVIMIINVIHHHHRRRRRYRHHRYRPSSSTSSSSSSSSPSSPSSSFPFSFKRPPPPLPPSPGERSRPANISSRFFRKPPRSRPPAAERIPSPPHLWPGLSPAYPDPPSPPAPNPPKNPIADLH